MNAADVLAALQLLTQAALTTDQIRDLMMKPDLSEADVLAQLNQTDATIDRVKQDD